MKTNPFLITTVFLIFLTAGTTAQLVSVSGSVQDNFSGKNIKQISVVEGNSGIGTITSDNGTFFLLLKSGDVKLTFSDDNYEAFSTSFVLSSDTTIFVKLNAVNMGAGRKEKQVTADNIKQSEYEDNKGPGKNK